MKLFHLSLIIDKEIYEFIPRTPDSEFEDENNTIPRICVSSSIEGCIMAAPWGMRGLSNLCLINIDRESYKKLHGIDEGGMYVNLRVYEFETDTFIDSEYLQKTGLVPDAVMTGECWILERVKPSKVYNIKVYNTGEIIDETGRLAGFKDFKYEIIKQ